MYVQNPVGEECKSDNFQIINVIDLINVLKPKSNDDITGLNKLINDENDLINIKPFFDDYVLYDYITNNMLAHVFKDYMMEIKTLIINTYKINYNTSELMRFLYLFIKPFKHIEEFCIPWYKIIVSLHKELNKENIIVHINKILNDIIDVLTITTINYEIMF